MTENDKFVRKVIIKTIILVLIESIIILISFKNFIPLISGLYLGAFISILFFNIMYINILYIMNKTENQAKKFMVINYVVRYMISGLVLFVCAKSDSLNIFTCLLGLLSIKFTFYLNNFISLFSRKKE